MGPSNSRNRFVSQTSCVRESKSAVPVNHGAVQAATKFLQHTSKGPIPIPIPSANPVPNDQPNVSDNDRSSDSNASSGQSSGIFHFSPPSSSEDRPAQRSARSARQTGSTSFQYTMPSFPRISTSNPRERTPCPICGQRVWVYGFNRHVHACEEQLRAKSCRTSSKSFRRCGLSSSSATDSQQGGPAEEQTHPLQPNFAPATHSQRFDPSYGQTYAANKYLVQPREGNQQRRRRVNSVPHRSPPSPPDLREPYNRLP